MAFEIILFGERVRILGQVPVCCIIYKHTLTKQSVHSVHVFFQTVLRIWDCLFFEGSKILFRVAVALVLLNKERILAAKNFSELMDLFKVIVADPLTLHCHTFMQVCIHVNLSFSI